METLRLGNEAQELHLRVDITDSMIKQLEIQIGKDANITSEVRDIVFNYSYFHEK